MQPTSFIVLHAVDLNIESITLTGDASLLQQQQKRRRDGQFVLSPAWSVNTTSEQLVLDLTSSPLNTGVVCGRLLLCWALLTFSML